MVYGWHLNPPCSAVFLTQQVLFNCGDYVRVYTHSQLTAAGVKGSLPPEPPRRKRRQPNPSTLLLRLLLDLENDDTPTAGPWPLPLVPTPRWHPRRAGMGLEPRTRVGERVQVWQVPEQSGCDIGHAQWEAAGEYVTGKHNTHAWERPATCHHHRRSF